jgi:hypothetical protein
MKSLTKLALASSFALSLGACSSGPTLVGAWRAMYTVEGYAVTETLTFTGGPMTGSLTSSSTASNSTTMCMRTSSLTGTWMDTATTTTINVTSGNMAQSGCMDATQNFAMRALTADELTAVNAGIGGSYTLTATQLTLRASGQMVTYTRQ